MQQIIFNYLCVLILPALIGFLVRFLFRRAKKSFWITATLIVLAVLSWIVAIAIPAHGSELYAIRAMMVTSASISSLVTGLAIQRKVNR